MKTRIYLFLIITLFFSLMHLNEVIGQQPEIKNKAKVIFIKDQEKESYELFINICSQMLKKESIELEIIELDLGSQLFSSKIIFAQTIAKIKEQQPDLILSLGFSTTSQIAKNITDIPIVFSLILKNDAEFIKIINNKVTGVVVDFLLEEKIKLIKEMSPNVTSLGLICSLKKSKKTIYETKVIARNFNINPVIIEVDDEKLLQKALIENIDNIQALAIIPSDIIFSPESMSYIISLSAERGKFFIGLDNSDVKEGALFSIYPNTISLAKKAATIIQKILSYQSPSAIPFMEDNSHFKALNVTTAKRVEAKITSDLLNKVDVLMK